MSNITAVREFNQHGYVWYPQVWVEAYKKWFDIRSVRHSNPEGFTNANQAIQVGKEHHGI